MARGKVLARNTLFMYFRMFVLMIIYLYTSRILLKQLGIDDYGIFSLVGSVVAMFESVKILFTSSTQRFLNYVMEQNNAGKLRRVFSTSIYINMAIAVFFLISVELVGIWFLEYKANIPPSRMFAAHIVLQLTLLSTIVSIITTPFDAVLIAHEKMDIYALFSLFDGILKLVIVFLLSSFHTDRLILYGILLLSVTLLIRVCTLIYCRLHFKECYLTKSYDKGLLRSMMMFAGWKFFGNASSTVSQNGLNMLLNMFAGPVLNTTRGISYQVRSGCVQFLSNITVVVNPYITKLYAQDNKQKMFSVMFFSSKIVFLLDMVIVVPLMLMTEKIVFIWLGKIPIYSVVFIQILVAETLVIALRQQLDNVFNAVGNLKWYQICDCLALFLPFICSYFLLKQGMPYHYTFIAFLVSNLVGYFILLFIAKSVTGLNIRHYIKEVFVHCLVCTVFLFVFYQLNYRVLHAKIVYSLILSIIADVVCVLYMMRVALNKNEKKDLINLLSNSKFSFLTKFL